MKSLGVGLTAVVALLLAAPAGATGNGLIAFTRGGDVWVVHPDGSGAENLTDGRAGAVSGPLAWSPDGAHLAFQGSLAPFTPAFGGGFPYSIRADGSGLTLLAAMEAPQFTVGCWLSDDELVLLGNDGGTVDFWLVDADGTGRRQLTNDGGMKSLLPTGCARASRSVYYTSGPRMYRLRPDAGGPVLLTVPETVDSAPSASRDGDAIAFVRAGATAPTAFAAYIARPDGSELSQVRAPRVWPYGPAILSPDERILAVAVPEPFFQRSRFDPFEQADIHTIEIATRAEAALTNSLTNELPLEWSPDGTRVLYSIQSETVAVMNADGTCETPIAGSIRGWAAWQPVPAGGPMAPIACVDLDMRASAATAPVEPNGRAALEFDVQNDGSLTASDARVDFVLPELATAISASTSQGSCSADARYCLIGDVPPHSRAHVVLTIQVGIAPAIPPRAVPFTVGATVSAPGAGTDEADNRAAITVVGWTCTQVGTPGRDSLVGGGGQDILCGLSGPDVLYGKAGDDLVDGGPGFDWLSGGSGRDTLVGGGEDDVLVASDGGRDYVDCGGSGEDLAFVDRADVTSACEHLVRTTVRCTKVGTLKSDDLSGGRAADRICGGPGGDTINGAGANDALDGNQGDDTLIGGPGSDTLIGGSGNDTLHARDGKRDRIYCGASFDVVVRDRVDRVAPDCERVLK